MFLAFLCIAALFLVPEISPISLDQFAPEVREQVREAYVRYEANPQDAAAAGELGMLLHAYGENERAIQYYEKARSLEGTEFRWAYYLGMAQAERSRHAAAVSALRAAVGLNPEHVPARLRLADSLLAAGEIDESERVYRGVLAQSPDAARAHYGWGRVKVRRGDLEGAAESYETACRLYPNYGAAHYALALVYRDLNQRTNARTHLDHYQDNPRSSPPWQDPYLVALDERRQAALSYLEKGVDFESAGDIEAAIKEHERALEINPQLALAHVNLITLYGQLARLEDAERHYHAVLRLNPDFAEAHYNYGVLLFRRKELEKAAEAFARALEINPYYPEAHFNLGSLLEHEGRLDQASERYQKALENRPDYRLAHFRLGRILLHRKNFKEAIEHFSRTLTPEDEETPRYLYALAVAHARASNYEAALDYARQARRQASDLGQNDLVESIEKDLRLIEEAAGPKIPWEE